MKMVASVAALILASGAGGWTQDDSTTKPWWAKLGTMRVSIDFKDAPLEDVIAYLREISGINMLVDSEVRTKYGDDQLRVTMKLRDVSLKSALKLTLSSRELAATVREGVIVILPRERLAENLTFQIYDVRDLLLKIQDFKGPIVELVSTSGANPRFGVEVTLPEDHAVSFDEGTVGELVKASTGEGSWENNSNAAIEFKNGHLFVNQSPKVQREIRDFLDRLRQFK